MSAFDFSAVIISPASDGRKSDYQMIRFSSIDASAMGMNYSSRK
ncbi:hypothetical protein HMPREF1619_03440 [Klebsiella pneumoniae 909957]|nr:hypothetical protein HMPREF1619_03440 [Klebsiella pneumoniae 909957]